MLAFATISSFKLTSTCQRFENSSGEYHNPPTIKALTAATTTANQFTDISILTSRYYYC